MSLPVSIMSAFGYGPLTDFDGLVLETLFNCGVVSRTMTMEDRCDMLVYGASGFTAKLFLRRYLSKYADRRDRVILAGRSPQKIKAVGKEFGCKVRIFDVEEAEAQDFSDIVLVVNLAGPFIETQEYLIRACLNQGCHYIDICSEVDEVKEVYAYHRRALEAGIQIMPACGFGVVPTDLVAKMACDQLPSSPKYLQIGLATEGSPSRGTLGSVLPAIEIPGYKVVDGKLHLAMPAESSHEFEVAGKKFVGVCTPNRADIFVSHISTGCPNITTYSQFPSIVVWMMKGWFLWLRDFFMDHALQYTPAGPTDDEIDEGRTYIAATAMTETGEESTVALQGPEVYSFTAAVLTAVVARIFKGHYHAGFVTPSYYGQELLAGIEHVEWYGCASPSRRTRRKQLPSPKS